MDINNTFKITTINVAGLNTSLKQEQVLNFMKINKINILGVTETKLKNSIVENLYQNEKEYTSWWTCDDDNYYSTGVGIIMEKAYAKHVQTKDLFKGRLIHLTMFMKGKIRLSIILVYNYANNTQKPEILELYDKINEIIKSERKFQSRVIILGDFNINNEEFLEKQRKNLSIP
ncbi:DNase I-like protein [Rhizophagus irregularis]|uniref:DNase I-like protein n=1 Tax=Rhizophagus irregularis TaxID=588596 RepID=A0A2N1MCY9_9GLOM|nr:DNase I-like protein [Rhizophagus irregularis]